MSDLFSAAAPANTFEILSPHFSLVEAANSNTAVRLGIDNTPPLDVRPRLAFVAAGILEPIRDQFGPFTPSSWYRCAALNAKVGGKPSSQHLAGEAVDVKIVNQANPALAQWIRERLVFDQLILEFHTSGEPFSGWVHVSLIDEAAPENRAAGRRNRRELLTIGPAGTTAGLNA